MSYVIATGLVEAFWPRVELAEFAIGYPDGGWRVHESARGWNECRSKNFFDREQGWVRIDTFDLIESALANREGEGSQIAELTMVHEAAHVLDCPNKLAHSTENYRADLYSIWAPMFADYRATGNLSGLTDYAYTNYHEWFAVAVDRFTNRAHRSAIAKESPQLYHLLRGYLGRTDLPEAPAGM